MTLGDKIKRLRKSMRLTQTELGEKVGVKKNAVSKWECGRVEDIPTSTIKALANLFNVPTSYLIDDEEREFSSIDNIIPMPKMYKIPLLGTIACGTPILAVENIEEEIDIPEHIHADFALRCKGDSMIGADIRDGDIVYIKQGEAMNGQIAAVLIGEEATLKRFYYDRDANIVTLVSENPSIPPRVYQGETLDHIRVLGRAVGFTRALV